MLNLTRAPQWFRDLTGSEPPPITFASLQLDAVTLLAQADALPVAAAAPLHGATSVSLDLTPMLHTAGVGRAVLALTPADAKRLAWALVEAAHAAEMAQSLGAK